MHRAWLFWWLPLSLVGGCRGSSNLAAWKGISPNTVSGSSGDHETAVVSDSALKPFLPERLGRRLGEPVEGIMIRMGEKALTEVRRSYHGADGTTELKLTDARSSPRVAQAIHALSQSTSEDLSEERLILPGAVGYAHFDEEDRVAQAQIVIAGRFVASATVAEADGPQEAAAALRSLDTAGLAQLAQSRP